MKKDDPYRTLRQPIAQIIRKGNLVRQIAANAGQQMKFDEQWIVWGLLVRPPAKGERRPTPSEMVTLWKSGTTSEVCSALWAIEAWERRETHATVERLPQEIMLYPGDTWMIKTGPEGLPLVFEIHGRIDKAIS